MDTVLQQRLLLASRNHLTLYSLFSYEICCSWVFAVACCFLRLFIFLLMLFSTEYSLYAIHFLIPGY